MMTDGVEAGVIIGDAVIMIADAAITMDDATTADLWATRSGALSAAFFAPAINPVG